MQEVRDAVEAMEAAETLEDGDVDTPDEMDVDEITEEALDTPGNECTAGV